MPTVKLKLWTWNTDQVWLSAAQLLESSSVGSPSAAQCLRQQEAGVGSRSWETDPTVPVWDMGILIARFNACFLYPVSFMGCWTLGFLPWSCFGYIYIYIYTLFPEVLLSLVLYIYLSYFKMASLFQFLFFSFISEARAAFSLGTLLSFYWTKPFLMRVFHELWSFPFWQIGSALHKGFPDL